MNEDGKRLVIASITHGEHKISYFPGEEEKVVAYLKDIMDYSGVIGISYTVSEDRAYDNLAYELSSAVANEYGLNDYERHSKEEYFEWREEMRDAVRQDKPIPQIREPKSLSIMRDYQENHAKIQYTTDKLFDIAVDMGTDRAEVLDGELLTYQQAIEKMQSLSAQGKSVEAIFYGEPFQAGMSYEEVLSLDVFTDKNTKTAPERPGIPPERDVPERRADGAANKLQREQRGFKGTEKPENTGKRPSFCDTLRNAVKKAAEKNSARQPISSAPKLERTEAR